MASLRRVKPTESTRRASQREVEDDIPRPPAASAFTSSFADSRAPSATDDPFDRRDELEFLLDALAADAGREAAPGGGGGGGGGPGIGDDAGKGAYEDIAPSRACPGSRR